MPVVSHSFSDASALIVVLACLGAAIGTGRRCPGDREVHRVDPRSPDARSGSAEPELRRIRWIIHDQAIQRLTALGWWAERSLGEEGAVMASEARAIVDELRVVLGTDRRPAVADLVAVLRTIVDEQQRPGSTPVHLLVRDASGGDAGEVPRLVADAACAVTREAVRNAVRHGSATQVVVDAHLDASALWIEVADDGVGIDPEARRQADARGHRGLRGMFERASAVGARLELVTGMDGTRVTFGWRR